MMKVRSRPYKIDLIISKRRKQTLSESVRKDQVGEDNPQEKKKSGHRKMIHLTVNNRIPSHRQKPLTNPQANLNHDPIIAISQFKLEISEPEQDVFKRKQNDMLSSVHEKSSNEQQEQWWNYIKSSQDDSKMEIVRQLVKRQKKIQFFLELLKQNGFKFKSQKNQKIERYESYLSKLKEMYSQQISQAQELQNNIRQLEAKSNEQLYHQLRVKINKDGKRGLNFSPKRMSLFSGITGTLLLSKKTSGSEERRRNCNQFSFGSSLRKVSNQQSHLKHSKDSMFLDEGRITIYKKRLNFNT